MRSASAPRCTPRVQDATGADRREQAGCGGCHWFGQWQYWGGYQCWYWSWHRDSSQTPVAVLVFVSHTGSCIRSVLAVPRPCTYDAPAPPLDLVRIRPGTMLRPTTDFRALAHEAVGEELGGEESGGRGWHGHYLGQHAQQFASWITASHSHGCKSRSPRKCRNSCVGPLRQHRPRLDARFTEFPRVIFVSCPFDPQGWSLHHALIAVTRLSSVGTSLSAPMPAWTIEQGSVSRERRGMPRTV